MLRALSRKFLTTVSPSLPSRTLACWARPAGPTATILAVTRRRCLTTASSAYSTPRCLFPIATATASASRTMSTSAPAMGPSTSLTFTDADPKALNHVLGHPLPALIYLDSTRPSQSDVSEGAAQTQNEDTPTSDLFLIAIQKPVLVFLLPDAHASAYPEAQHRLRSLLSGINAELPRLRELERAQTGEELEVMGLSSASFEGLKQLAEELKLDFLLLSDPTFRFASGLELPTFSVTRGPSSETETETIPPGSQPQKHLQRLTLLLRQGQVVRMDAESPHFPFASGEQAATLLVASAVGLLKSDEELLREHAEQDRG